MTIDNLIAGRRAVVTVGSGGVGKTTVAAAIGVRAAALGRKVIVCTVDPARRLADAMGLGEMAHDPVRVDPRLLAPAGTENAGELSALMLDAKHTMEELVRNNAPDAGVRDRLLDNRIFRTIVDNMAGTREYMAMEKLWQLSNDERYDFIVLDTPPTTSAVDFLEAPGRMITAWDSSAVQWFLKPFQKAGRFSLRMLSFGSSFVLRQLARFVGASMLEDVAIFLLDLNELFEGFQARAKRVEAMLRGDDVGFVLVSGADSETLKEMRFMRERLEQAQVRLCAYVINRVYPRFDAGDTAPALSAAEVAGHVGGFEALAPFSGDTAPVLAQTMVRNLDEIRALAEIDHERIAELRSEVGETPVYAVPQFEEDVNDLVGLQRMVELLLT